MINSWKGYVMNKRFRILSKYWAYGAVKEFLIKDWWFEIKPLKNKRVKIFVDCEEAMRSLESWFSSDPF